MIFQVFSKDLEILEGYRIAGEILLSNDFLSRIQNTVKFTYTKKSSREIADRLEDIQDRYSRGLIQRIQVREYCAENNKVVATTFPYDPAIYVNTYRNAHRTIETYIQNGAHEFGHYPLGFSHGSNHPPGSWLGKLKGDWEDKNLSVPHTLGRICLELAKAKGLV